MKANSFKIQRLLMGNLVFFLRLKDPLSAEASNIWWLNNPYIIKQVI